METWWATGRLYKQYFFSKPFPLSILSRENKKVQTKWFLSLHRVPLSITCSPNVSKTSTVLHWALQTQTAFGLTDQPMRIGPLLWAKSPPAAEVWEGGEALSVLQHWEHLQAEIWTLLCSRIHSAAQ